VGLVVLASCRSGFDEHDARIGDGAGDASDPLPHVSVAPGWTKSVYVDFSADFTYNANDFVDGTNGETIVDNQPYSLAVLGAPFAEILAVGAGRTIIELSSTRYIEHDYGMHSQDTSAPDDFVRSSLIPDAGGSGPRLGIVSSSDGGGDGLFLVNTAWMITRDMSSNNARAFLWDAAGMVQGTPQVFVGTGSGMQRRPDTMTVIIPGDYRCMLPIAGGMVFVRNIGTDDQRLVRALWNGTMFVEAELAVRETIDLADGERPASGLSWAVTNLEQVNEIANDGTMTTIATNDTPAFVWHGSAVPPIGHALAATKRSIYVLETNRDQDMDRVLVFTHE
jgi:hypothetical protein